MKISKKILSFVLSALVAGSVAVIPSNAETVNGLMYGDTNGDMKVNSIDALSILGYSVGKVTLTENQLICADVNGDGNVNSVDALDVLRYSVGLIDCFSVEKKEIDRDTAVSIFNNAVNRVMTVKPSYTHKENVINTVDDVELSGAALIILSSAKIKELEENIKSENSIDRSYYKIVKQNSNDSAERMIGSLKKVKSDQIKSLSCVKKSDGNYLMSISFGDAKNPGAESPAVCVFDLDSYSEAKKKLEESDNVEGTTSKVDELNFSYKNCVLNCVIDGNTTDFLSIDWSADIVSESKVTTMGISVFMKTSGKRSAVFSNFGY